MIIFCYSYYIERGVCYLVLCDKTFSKRLAYAFLEDLQTEFASTYASKFETVSRPYSFIEFGLYAFTLNIIALLMDLPNDKILD